MTFEKLIDAIPFFLFIIIAISSIEIANRLGGARLLRRIFYESTKFAKFNRKDFKLINSGAIHFILYKNKKDKYIASTCYAEAFKSKQYLYIKFPFWAYLFGSRNFYIPLDRLQIRKKNNIMVPVSDTQKVMILFTKHVDDVW